MDISETGSRPTIEEINESRDWFFEQINKIDKPLARLINAKRGKTKMTNTRNHREGHPLRSCQHWKGQKVALVTTLQNASGNVHEGDKLLATHVRKSSPSRNRKPGQLSNVPHEHTHKASTKVLPTEPSNIRKGEDIRTSWDGPGTQGIQAVKEETKLS